MHYTILPEEMKQLEKDYMARTGVPGALLMEHAAQGILQQLCRMISTNSTVLFLCGPGNNGGDGYAAARLWQAQGGKSLIWELKQEETGDAGMNRRLALQMDLQPVRLSACPAELPFCHAVVDALFGTGLSRPITGIAAELIELVNKSDVPVLAVDIPSGLMGDSGLVPEGGSAIRAQATVTFHRIKQGLMQDEALKYTGRLILHPILIPKHEGNMPGMAVLEETDIPVILPPRPADAHKGTMGRLVILAGSAGMAGAAALCARAALRSGAGLTTLLCRESIWPILQALVPGATCRILPERQGRLLPEAADIVRSALMGADAAVIGCGLGQQEDLLPLLEQFRQADCPIVWDADALNLLSRHPELLPLKHEDIITPHPGEAARLCPAADRLQQLKALARECGCHVLLKGARSLMTDGQRTAVNPTGSPALAKGGSGDILSGVIGALMARQQAAEKHKLPFADTLSVLQAAAWLHGRAGERAAEQWGENGPLPEDIVDLIRI